ncbi:MAG: glycyl-radical enzyme activating protein [Candidatus Zixiibacteriota bacterium]
MNNSSSEIKGLIFDIKKYAIHDGPGIRTTVFLKGCPLDCWWCHNPEGRSDTNEIFKRHIDIADGGKRIKEEKVGRLISVAELMKELKKDTVFYDQSGGGITFSGGEPMQQIGFLEAALSACKNENLITAVDTCGYAPIKDFERIYPLTDIFLYDIKLMDDGLHQKYTGVSNQQIFDNLAFLAGQGDKINLRIPLIPGITDTAENLEAIVRFISAYKNIKHISLLPYNRLNEDKTKRFALPDRMGKLQAQSEESLKGKAAFFEKHGYIVKVGG